MISSGYSPFPSIMTRTATRDLIGLVEKSLLVKHGEKKGTYYLLSPENSGKIRDIKGHA